jgi:hypothetical protein
MERLPYIDEHSGTFAAGEATTWAALIAVLRGTGQPAWRSYAQLVGCEPAKVTGDWLTEPELGATIPGFRVEDVDAPRRLVLSGKHRFSRYELTFVLERAELPGRVGTRLRAETRATFPGVTGTLYRALVIGSGAHVLATCRLLWLVGKAASRREDRAARQPAPASGH